MPYKPKGTVFEVDMEYKIRKKNFYVSYRHVNWSMGAPCCVSDATYAAPPTPIERLHYHNMYEMGVCIEGRGEYQICDRLYHFKQGDVVFVNRFTPHFSNSESGHPAKWKMVFFDSANIMRYAGMIDPYQASSIANAELCFSGVFEPQEHPELTDFITKTTELAQTQDELTDLSIAFCIGNFILECLRYLKQHPVTDMPAQIDNKNYHKICPAVDMISCHISNSKMISEQALAELCKMSVSTLRRLFKKYIGLAPKAYINNARMAYAEYLIRSTNLTVLEISNEIGYSEVVGFNRIFKATFGMTPSEYRKHVGT